MFRLRTTTTLSLVALAVGIAGTHWLSGQNTGWAGPSERVAGYLPRPARTTPAAAPVRAARHAPPPVLRRAAPALVEQVPRRAAPALVEPVQAAPATPELVPLSTPTSQVPWAQMEGHLQGLVLLRLRIDGHGRVIDAALAQSSGDGVLDAHALASVRGWRFAVPADHPDGFSGELPMRYTSGGQRVVQAP